MDEENESIYPQFSLTGEMIETIKRDIIPRLKVWGINSNIEYSEKNEEYEVDNVDLFQDLWQEFPEANKMLKIYRDDFDDEEEYDEAREEKWNEIFDIDEGQLRINLGIEYLEDTEWN